jgi:glycosyltransferase involved in cell wall biosynthesis
MFRMTRSPDPAIQVDELPAARHAMRIAVVTETYPPEVNGVAVTIARFVEGLRARNHDIQLIRPRQRSDGDDHASTDQVLLRGVPIPAYPHLKMGLPSKGELVNLWKHKRPDVVHVVTEGPLGWSAVQAAAKLRIPTTSDFRTNFHTYSKHYGVGWLRRPIMAYLRKFHNRTRLTFVPTEALRRQLTETGFENVKVVARGVDTHLYGPQRRSADLRRSWGAGADTTVVLHVGRLASEKNLTALLGVYDALQPRKANLRFVFVGDGPVRRQVQRRCPQAVFAGMRSGTDLAAHYASGDVFLFPSTTETFGNVTAEAMASGLAVLAYDYAAAAQLIKSGVSGLLAPYDNALAFLRMSLDLVGDAGRIRALGRAARRVAEGLDWEHVVDQLEGLIAQAAVASAVTNTLPRQSGSVEMSAPMRD